MDQIFFSFFFSFVCYFSCEKKRKLHNAQNRLSFHSHFGINRNEKNGIPQTNRIKEWFALQANSYKKKNNTSLTKIECNKSHTIHSHWQFIIKREKKNAFFCIYAFVDIERRQNLACQTYSIIIQLKTVFIRIYIYIH